MRKLILVRHSLPVISSKQPASQWQLSDEGRRRCERLAELLAPHRPGAIVTSTEPKAIETGQIVGKQLGIPVEAAPDLHEHERPGTDLDTVEQFQAKVGRLLQHPDEQVFGVETGDEARERFNAAVCEVMRQHPGGNLAIVSHGTVITLFVARAAGIEPVPFWRALSLPAFAVLSYPSLALLGVAATVV
ncbi:MAG: histidine phosphatase family protein [Anaerolineae bacterium]|jgi:broad specificity phosphatase PhoE